MDTGRKDESTFTDAPPPWSNEREALTRRAFLKQAAFVAAAMAAPFPVLADPYAPQSQAAVRNGVRPVRISGRVAAGNAGLGGVRSRTV